MLDTATIERLATRLDEAERTKTLITMFSKDHPDFSIEDAYAVQRAWTRLQLGRGRVIKGHKIGLTSKAMQNAVGISEPDYGVLFADMFYADATPIPFDRFQAPRIEVELAFVLKAPLRGPDCTIFDVLNATDYVTPAAGDPGDAHAPRRSRNGQGAKGHGHDLGQRGERRAGAWRPAFPSDGRGHALDRRAVVPQRRGRGNRACRRRAQPSRQRHCLARQPPRAA
jgi:hypothetical protein